MVTTTSQELLELAKRAAVEAAGYVRKAMSEPHLNTATKSSATDMVTESDRIVEQLIVETLLTSRPGDGILGEEGAQVDTSSGVTWIIDPIDGTTNFTYGLPGFNTSIAASVNGEVTVGVVVDPLRHELFTAVRGEGAWCNDEPIHCTDQDDLALSLVGTGFSYDAARRTAQAETVAGLIGDVRDIRRLGAAALDLCMVGAGRVDAYFESGLHPWDLSAGALIASEAGAQVAGLDDPSPSHKFVIAAAPGIFGALQSRLRALDAAGR